MEKKLIGLKKAVGSYKRLNAGGWYSPHYAELMLDKETGEIWADEFYSLGHNNWKEYHCEDIINLGAKMARYNEEAYYRNKPQYPVTMAGVKAFCNDVVFREEN